jgi:hypothetical protein
MHWMDWVVVGLSALGTLVTVASIGDERRPLTRAHAVWSLLLNTLLIVALLWSHAAAR